jgi:hypothetical protein
VTNNDALERRLAKHADQLADLEAEIARLKQRHDADRQTFVDAIGTTGGKATVATTKKKTP